MNKNLLLIAPLLLSLSSCTQPASESRITDNAVALSRLGPSLVLAQRSFARTVMTGPLADAQGIVPASITALLENDEGAREMLALFIGCALPEDAVLVAPTSDGDLTYFGQLALAPQWRTGPLNLDGQRWVSACIFSKLNSLEELVPISMRGPHPGLALAEEESDAYDLEDGAFYGNMFVPLNQEVQWYACRGRDQAAGKQGDLQLRDCALPDPNKPGITKCGMSYAGDCGSFAPERACELFASNGLYYRRCHTVPSQNGVFQGAPFEQVVTVFVRE